MIYPLSAESKALIERLLRERDEAQNRLDIAVIATKAALGVPDGYEIKDLKVGFVQGVTKVTEVTNGGDN